MTRHTVSRARLIEWLDEEGMPATATELLRAAPADAPDIARRAADDIERYGYKDGQAIGTAIELRRWANIGLVEDGRATDG